MNHGKSDLPAAVLRNHEAVFPFITSAEKHWVMSSEESSDVMFRAEPSKPRRMWTTFTTTTGIPNMWLSYSSDHNGSLFEI